MTTTPKKLATTTAATFAAAMTSLYGATELQAQVVGIAPIDPLPETINLQTTGIDATSVGNSLFFGDVLGPNVFSAGSFGAGIAIVNPGDVIDTATFSGAATLNFGASATGTAFVGFQLFNDSVGFFQVDFGDTAGGSVAILGGQVGLSGEAVTIPGAAVGVPEPASGLALAALALGAVGVRRKRQVA